jgi:hypothetical protein
MRSCLASLHKNGPRWCLYNFPVYNTMMAFLNQQHTYTQLPSNRESRSLNPDFKMARSTVLPPSDMSLFALTSRARSHRTSTKTVPLKARYALTKPKKRVSFAMFATVQDHPLRPSDLQATWYQAEEYFKFDRERRRTIEAIRSSRGNFSSLDPENICIRGLEHQLSAKQVLSRKYKSMQYKRLLLERQYYLKQYGVSDPESLQIVSQMFSKESTRSAYLRAMFGQCLE